MRRAPPFLFISIVFLSFSISKASPRPPQPTQRHIKYSLTKGEVVPIPANQGELPLEVYGEVTKKNSPFVASGYMGDVQALRLNAVSDSAPLSSGKAGRNALKIVYLPKGREGWTGVYWLTPANNWGKIKGAGYDLSAADRLTFWARGEKGGEKITEIKMGGIVGSYPDTDTASLGPLRLSKDWEEYSIELTGKDLRHIIGGFAFVLRRADNARGATFYLDEIVYSGSSGSSPHVSEVQISSPSTTAAPSSAPSEPKLLQPIKKIIPFDTAKASFQVNARNELEEIITLAKIYPHSFLRVEGHTDDVGPAEMNVGLSKERATTVRDYLVDQGISENRIAILGRGEENPLLAESNQTPEGRRNNRRVEVILMAEE